MAVAGIDACLRQFPFGIAIAETVLGKPVPIFVFGCDLAPQTVERQRKTEFDARAGKRCIHADVIPGVQVLLLSREHFRRPLTGHRIQGCSRRGSAFVAVGSSVAAARPTVAVQPVEQSPHPGSPAAPGAAVDPKVLLAILSRLA